MKENHLRRPTTISNGITKNIAAHLPYRGTQKNPYNHCSRPNSKRTWARMRKCVRRRENQCASSMMSMTWLLSSSHLQIPADRCRVHQRSHEYN